MKVLNRLFKLLQQGLGLIFNSGDIAREPVQDHRPPTLSDFYDLPEIVDVNITMPLRGSYYTHSGRPRGLVVHYTAGHAGSGIDVATSALFGLMENGLACMVMDTDGVIYRGRNQTLNKAGWHAGKSKWLGQTSVSFHCMGMEVINEGNLTKSGRTWFNTIVPGGNVRHVDSRHNVVGGYYSKFTKAQEKALLDFCLWQMDTNPDFDIAWIVGHDEVAGDSSRPGYGKGKGLDVQRKPDPGGSFSKTMWEFREELLEIQGKCQ